MPFPSARPCLLKVKNYEPGKPLEELEREYGIRRAVKMASNENALGPSPKAVLAMRKALKRVHRYPESKCHALRQALSRRLGVSPESLIFGNGSDEVLVLAVRAFVEGGDQVVIADPTFLIYEIAARTQNGGVVKVPMKDFRYDLEGMRRKLSAKTKVIFIANPDNPVGTYVREKDLVRFLRAVPRRVVVVLDEAYYEFARDMEGYPDSLSLLKTFKNLLVTRTFSKAYGLSGLRMGYGIAHPSIVEALNKVREPFNVNLLAQEAAAAALDDRSHLERTLEMVRKGREYFYDEFKELRLSYVETVTNFVLADLRTDARVVYEKLLRKGVIVRPMTAWGLKTFIRVTIGKMNENRRFVKALKETLTK